MNDHLIHFHSFDEVREFSLGGNLAKYRQAKGLLDKGKVPGKRLDQRRAKRMTGLPKRWERERERRVARWAEENAEKKARYAGERERVAARLARENAEKKARWGAAKPKQTARDARERVSTSTMKTVLRDVRANRADAVNLAGGKINRRLPDGTLSPASVFTPVAAGGYRRGVTVAKDSSEPISRRMAALHEIGHSMDPSMVRNVSRKERLARAGVTPTQGEKLLRKRHSPLLTGQVEAERRANRNAVSLLKRNNAPREDVDNYRRAMRKPFNSYRSAHVRMRTAFRNPGLNGAVPLSEAKRTLREHPYLRGYGFSVGGTRFPPARTGCD